LAFPALEMEPADGVFRRSYVVILHPAKVNADLFEQDLVVAFEEKAAMILVNGGRDNQQSVDFCALDLHMACSFLRIGGVSGAFVSLDKQPV
jgi:hypothetical protein